MYFHSYLSKKYSALNSPHDLSSVEAQDVMILYDVPDFIRSPISQLFFLVLDILRLISSAHCDVHVK